MIAYCKMETLKVKKDSNHFALKARLYQKAIKAAMEELFKWKHAPVQQHIPLLG